MSQGLGQLGEVLESAVETAAAEGRELKLLPTNRTMVLCAIRTIRKANQRSFLTVSAHERVAGDIILGPFATRRESPTIEHLECFMQAHRWVLNPVHMGDGTNKPVHSIVGPPTISLMHRVETKCSACGHIAREWKDVVIMRSKPADSSEHRVTRWDPSIDTDCNECHSRPVAQHKLWCTAIRQLENSWDDPVLDNEKDRAEVTEAMLKAWQDGPPADGKSTIMLPRIWAVYRKDQVPDPTWKPTDERAQRLADRAASFQRSLSNGPSVSTEPYPLGILPFDVARPYHLSSAPISTALIKLWLECDHVAVGWVQRSELFPTETLGFRRTLWHEPKRSNNRKHTTLYDYVIGV